jgi:thiamine-phosphate pyrophosphorylase
VVILSVMVSLPPLQAIVDVDVSERAGWTPLDLARAYFDGGARFLQLRAKLLPSSEFLELAGRLVDAAMPYGAAVIVNDRVDIAALAGAAGVHLGQDDLVPADARRIIGDAAIVGYSTHTVDQIAAALRQPASYIAVGPVFGTRTKHTGYEAVGLDLVAQAARAAAGRPIVAIGGITLATAAQVLAAGASCVAVIGDLLADDDPVAHTRSYLRALGQHRV